VRSQSWPLSARRRNKNPGWSAQAPAGGFLKSPNGPAKLLLSMNKMASSRSARILRGCCSTSLSRSPLSSWQSLPGAFAVCLWRSWSGVSSPS